MVFTSAVLQVVVSLVVEHLVGCQIHCRIEQLYEKNSMIKKYFLAIVTLFLTAVKSREITRSSFFTSTG